MKTKLLTLVTLAFIGLSTANAQVGIGTTNPDNSAALDVDVSSLPANGKKGFLPPRMDNTERGTITSPEPGLTIYNTEANCLQWYDGTTWFDPCEGATSSGGGGQQAPDPLPGNITLEPVSTYYIASADDADYLNGSGALPNNTTEAQLPGTAADDEADGATTETAIDIQGTLTTTGVTINIPYEVVTNPTTLPAFEQTITIPAEYTQGGTAAVDVKFSYPEQTNLAVGTGVVPATLQAVGSNLDVIKFDLNSGFGANYLGFLLGSFTYATDDAGNTADLEVRGIPGIPDKNIGDGVHDFVYLPVTGPSGKTWLNNNLGANYANINDAAFDPAQQATAFDDFNAYGSLFQWGRVADGHEIVDWINSTSGNFTNVITTLSSIPEPPHGDFIANSSAPNNWYTGTNPARINLWQENTKTIYDPCPNGYRVPTEAEWQAEITGGGWSNTLNAASSSLAISSAGRRSRTNGAYQQFGQRGEYWTSKAITSNEFARYLALSDTGATITSTTRAMANSIRCIQE